MAFFAPLAASVQLAEREWLFAIAAFALDLGKPSIRSNTKPGDVCGNDVAVCKLYGAVAVAVFYDLICGLRRARCVGGGGGSNHDGEATRCAP